MTRISRNLAWGVAILALALSARSPRAAGIDADIGGFVKFDYAADVPVTSSIRGGNAVLDGEAHLDISSETDTGITYGGRVQLVPAAKAGDNGTFAEAAWAWGEFRIGQYGGAAKELSVSAPTIGIGQISGDLDRFGAPSALIAPYALANDDSARLTYLSPAILGFRVGLSYAPELADGGFSVVPHHVPGTDGDRDVVEFGVQSSRDIGETTVTTGGAFVTGAAKAGVHLHDLDGGSLGAKLVWNGLTVGGAFVYDGAGTLALDRRPGHVLTDSVISEINLGATYQIGRWGFGGSWAHDYRKALASTDIVATGLVYRVVPGATIAADLARFTRPDGSRDRGTTALIIQTALHF